MKLNLKKKTAEQKILVGAHMYKSVKERLEQIATANGVPVSAVVRTAINDLLDREEML